MNAIDLLEKCHEDLESSRGDYSAGRYSNAIFSIQQSCEKCTKAMLFWGGLLKSDKDAKNIGHETVQGFVKLLDKFREFIPIVTQINPSINAPDPKYLQNKFKNPFFSMKICLLNKNEIIGEIEKVDRFVENNTHQGELSLLYVKTKIHRHIAQHPTQIKLTSQQVGMVDRFVESLLSYNMLNMAYLYPISIITFPHAFNARYSSTEMLIDTRNYNQSLGIVEAYPIIANRLEKSIIFFNKFFNESR